VERKDIVTHPTYYPSLWCWTKRLSTSPFGQVYIAIRVTNSKHSKRNKLLYRDMSLYSWEREWRKCDSSDRRRSEVNEAASVHKTWSRLFCQSGRTRHVKNARLGNSSIQAQVYSTPFDIMSMFGIGSTNTNAGGVNHERIDMAITEYLIMPYFSFHLLRTVIDLTQSPTFLTKWFSAYHLPTPFLSAHCILGLVTQSASAHDMPRAI
jgi:hypothetical protein